MHFERHCISLFKQAVQTIMNAANCSISSGTSLFAILHVPINMFPEQKRVKYFNMECNQLNTQLIKGMNVCHTYHNYRI